MLVLALHYASIQWSGADFTLYGLPLTSYDALVFARDMVKSENIEKLLRRMLKSSLNGCFCLHICMCVCVCVLDQHSPWM